MPDLVFTLDVEPNASVSNKVLIEISGFITYAMKKIIPTVLNKTKELVGEAIRNSPEYLALLPGGQLYGQVGLPNIVDVLEDIIKVLKDEIEIEVFPAIISFNSVSITMEIRILEDTYKGVLGVKDASFDSENGFVVDWLGWLLLEGQRKVVIGNDFIRRGGPYSRTGFGFMVHSDKGWGFSSPYSGTKNNNWFTRAFKGIEKKIADFALLELDKIP